MAEPENDPLEEQEENQSPKEDEPIEENPTIPDPDRPN